MDLRDDDDIHRARLLWLGPTDYTLPIHLPYAQWGMFAAITAVLSFLLVLVTGDWIWIGAAIGGGMFLTHYLWRFVNPDRPARTVLRTLAMDTKTIKATEGEQLPSLVASNITIHTEYPKG